jgi:hypothetical protein
MRWSRSVAATGIATGIEGMRFARQAPDGAIPLEDGDHTAPGADRLAAPDEAAGSTSWAPRRWPPRPGLVAVNAALGQQGFRRPPRRRAFALTRP